MFFKKQEKDTRKIIDGIPEGVPKQEKSIPYGTKMKEWQQKTKGRKNNTQKP